MLRLHFRPEFLNRLDEIIMFKPLTMQNMIGIVDLILKKLSNRLEEKHLTLKVTDRAKTALVNLSYNPQFGARPIKRFTQAKIETLIAKVILTEDLKAKDILQVDYDKEKEFFVNVITPKSNE